MKAKVKQINRYQITIGDKTYDDFKKCEEWEGMIKFSGPSGTLIVDGKREEFDEIFSRLFGSGCEGGDIELDIIKASPALAPNAPIPRAP